MQTTASKKIVTSKTLKYLMLKPQTRFKQPKATGTNSDGAYHPAFKTPSDTSKASPQGRLPSQLDQRANEPNKVDFYASQLISNETLLGLEETSQRPKNALSSHGRSSENRKPKAREPLYKSAIRPEDLNAE